MSRLNECEERHYKKSFYTSESLHNTTECQTDFGTLWFSSFSRRKDWYNGQTHVIASTDSNGACTRTLKVLIAILNGKWIVTVDWVEACVEAGCLVNEEQYEVHLDTHGCSGGPKAGRLRVLNNGPN